MSCGVFFVTLILAVGCQELLEDPKEPMKNLSALHYEHREFLKNMAADQFLNLTKLFAVTMKAYQSLKNHTIFRNSTLERCTNSLIKTGLENITLQALDASEKCDRSSILRQQIATTLFITNQKFLDGFPSCFKNLFALTEILFCIDKTEARAPTELYRQLQRVLKKDEDSLKATSLKCIKREVDEVKNSLILLHKRVINCTGEKLQDFIEKNRGSYVDFKGVNRPKTNSSVSSNYALNIDVVNTLRFRAFQDVQRKMWITQSRARELSRSPRLPKQLVSCCLEKLNARLERASNTSIRLLDDCFEAATLKIELYQTGDVRRTFERCNNNDSSVANILRCIDYVMVQEAELEAKVKYSSMVDFWHHNNLTKSLNIDYHYELVNSFYKISDSLIAEFEDCFGVSKNCVT